MHIYTYVSDLLIELILCEFRHTHMLCISVLILENDGALNLPQRALRQNSCSIKEQHMYITFIYRHSHST